MQGTRHRARAAARLSKDALRTRNSRTGARPAAIGNAPSAARASSAAGAGGAPAPSGAASLQSHCAPSKMVLGLVPAGAGSDSHDSLDAEELWLPDARPARAQSQGHLRTQGRAAGMWASGRWPQPAAAWAALAAGQKQNTLVCY